MRRFADYISLGGNCECGFAIRRYGQKRSHYFDWTNSNATITARVIEDDFRLVQQETHLTVDEGGLMFDNLYGYKFYGDGAWPAEKLDHMVNRFLNPRGRRLYILKTPYETPYKLARLLDALGSISKDFELVNLRPQECADSPIRMSHDRYRVHERYLKRYAPDAEVGDIHVVSYDRLFEEFPLVDDEACASVRAFARAAAGAG